MTVIHRAEALPALLAALEGRLGGVRVLPVQAFEDEPAKRVLVRAVKGSRAPFALLAPLVLHERPSGAATAQAAAILSGGAPISWSS